VRREEKTMTELKERSFVGFAVATFSSRNRRRAFFFFSERSILESRLEIQAPNFA